MKQLSKQITIVTMVLVSFSGKLKAQDKYQSNFIGINPSITVEPFYEKGELDINIIPLVYQRPLTRRIDLRLTSICNLGIRNNGNEISHFGLEIALPVFIQQKENKKESSSGFFVAPIISLTRNRMAQHNNTGIWIEPGYNLRFDNKFALSFGLQIGGTHFAYDNGQTKWSNHVGAKIIFGRWM